MALSNFSWVIPGKLAGSDLPGNASASERALWRDIEFLSNEGVKMLVSLERPYGSVGEICSSLGVSWHHFPVTDFGIPYDKTAFKKLIDSCVTWCTENLPVCIHCRAGIGRTGMVLACVYGKYMKCDASTAIEHIRCSRSAVETTEQRAFTEEFLATPD